MNELLTAAQMAKADAFAISGGIAGMTLMEAAGKAVADAAAHVEEMIGGIDILVANAGISGSTKPTVDYDVNEWHQVVNINLNGVFHCCRAVLPGMISRNYGRIVNVASTAARTAVADHPAYCASKAGLVGLTKALALEGAPHGVTCLSVSPTWVETDMLRATAAKLATANGTTLAEEVARFAAENPQGRLAQPAEIAHLIAMLCGEEMPALTMEDIQVNAGAHW